MVGVIQKRRITGEDVVATLGREVGREWESTRSEAAKTAADQSPGMLPTAERGRLR